MDTHTPTEMRQVAPYPHVLARLVECLRYRRDRGWDVSLVNDLQRDKPGRHSGEARGMTLVVLRCGPDSYHPESTIAVSHYFPVPAATYDERSWRRWLFDQLGKVDDHERMEDFILAVDHDIAPDGTAQESLWRPYAPSHGPGNDPYLVREVGTELDQRTSFRGEVNE